MIIYFSAHINYEYNSNIILSNQLVFKENKETYSCNQVIEEKDLLKYQMYKYLLQK